MTYGQYITTLYQSIYLVVVAIFTFFALHRYSNRAAEGIATSSNNGEKQPKFVLIFAFALSLFIGLRPHQGFGDSTNYIHMYEMREGQQFLFEWDTENVIWDNFFGWWASNGLGITNLFLLVASCYFILTYFACKKLFPHDSAVAYLVFLGAFSTFSYSTNGIKAGLAAAVFILALAYRDNLKLCIVLALLSWGVHHSMQLPAAALAVSLIIKKPKWYFLGWVFCALMAILHVSYFQFLFASMSDASGSSYLLGEGEFAFMTGFRPDFLIYSAIPVVIGYYAVYKKKIQLSKTYLCLLNTYLLTNGIWLLCMYASYTNRIAYLSWFMYPFVLIYPLLNENWGVSKYKSFAKIAKYHIAFSLFMHFIYYGMLTLSHG